MLDNAASYYDAGNISTMDVIRAKLTPEQYKGFLLGNVMKYSLRLNFKHKKNHLRADDARKARIYSELLEKTLEK